MIKISLQSVFLVLTLKLIMLQLVQIIRSE